MKTNDEFCISTKEFATLVRLSQEGAVGESAAFVRTVLRRIQRESPEAADLIAKSLSAAGSRVTRTEPAMPVDVDSRLELLRTERPQNVDSPIWPESQKRLMEQIVEEHQRRDELLRAGLTPTTTVLFSGPPGVGKTLSARWLSSELKVPLHTLDLSAVMSSFLGRTGNNLRNVLDYARGTECVLLLDEFDAIAKRRDDATEIGELKRLVTVLLQEIDTWPNVGLLIAATNHAELLDPAVWRRFDSVVHFQLPSKPDLESFLKRLFIEHPISEEMTSAVSSAYLGMSFSDLERDAERVRREAVMGGGDVQTLLLSLVKEQATRLRPKERKALALRLVDDGMTDVAAHRWTGVARDTIRAEKKKRSGG